MLRLLLLGFGSGLPLALTASTLTAWLSESGVTKASIGLFAAVGTPYALKFLWAPLIDQVRLPLLGKRRGWMVLMQLILMLLIAALAFADPSADPWATAFFALLVAIASATQDIAIDAYRIESLKDEEQGAGSAVFVFGYRLGMVASGAGALYLAQFHGWQTAYLVMAALVTLPLLVTLLSPEPAHPREIARKENFLRHAVVDPFKEFIQRPGWAMLLAFIILYKLGDAFLGVMTNPFLLEIGFAKDQIAVIVKAYGLIATIVGGLIGGAIVYRLGMMRSLLLCGIANALTNLMFLWQARVGADVQVLALSITLENLTGGMSLSAFVAYISSLTNRHFTATQYALLSALSAFGRTWLSTPAGWFAEKLGWEAFFILSAVLAIPSLILLKWLHPRRMAGSGIS